MHVPHLVRDPQFARGLYLTILVILLQLIGQVFLRPVGSSSVAMTYGPLVFIVLISLLLLPRRRQLAIGMLIGWVIFAVIPIAVSFFLAAAE